eukprot:767646-Hanusia_phi.AAC.12
MLTSDCSQASVSPPLLSEAVTSLIAERMQALKGNESLDYTRKSEVHCPCLSIVLRSATAPGAADWTRCAPRLSHVHLARAGASRSQEIGRGCSKAVMSRSGVGEMEGYKHPVRGPNKLICSTSMHAICQSCIAIHARRRNVRLFRFITLLPLCIRSSSEPTRFDKDATPTCHIS